MAEAIPFGLAQKIIEKLGSMALEEIGSIWGVKDELEKLKEHCFHYSSCTSRCRGEAGAK
jgi:hypothetical protein